jgi:transcription elongation factor GreA
LPAGAAALRPSAARRREAAFARRGASAPLQCAGIQIRVSLTPAVPGLFFWTSSMADIPITARGAERLKAELIRLKSVDRHAVIQAIKEAREKGDLSENAEYDAARERQGFIEGRIAELEGKLSALQIIDPATLVDDGGGRIVFGATVDLEDLDSGEKVRYQIVGDDEADIKAGLISVSSPISRALIGKSEGELIVVLAPGGKRQYEVLGVRYV